MKTKLLFIIPFAFVGLIVDAQCSVIAGTNSTICIGQSAQLSASANPAAVSYSWVPAGGLSCTNCANPIANSFFSNTYTVYTMDANACTASATVSVIVGSNPFLSAIASPSICVGDSAILNANVSNVPSAQQPVSWYWSPPNTLNNPNLQNPTAGPVTTTIYTVTVTDAYGCKDDTSTIVYVQTNPSASFCNNSVSGNTLTCCANISSNTVVCFWEFGDGTNFTTYPPNPNPPPHTYTFGGAYNVCLTVFNPPCKDSVCETITILGIDEYYLSSLIDISPNPSNGIFSIKSELKISSIEIMNILGEKIYQSEIKNQKSEIDFSKQLNGIYFLRMKTRKGIAIKKLIINK